MPKRSYAGKLTHEEIIALFNQGVYKVDIEAGTVHARNGRELYTFPGGNDCDDPDSALWVRLYSRGKMRSLPVAHCVWLFKSQRAIPDDFEIHHRNTNKRDNRWLNLFCLFDLDHRKLHRDTGEVDDLLETTPF